MSEVDWKWMYEEEHAKFMRETLRTSEQAVLLQEARAVCNFVALGMDSVPEGVREVGGWPLYRFARRVRGRIDELARTPINAGTKEGGE